MTRHWRKVLPLILVLLVLVFILPMVAQEVDANAQVVQMTSNLRLRQAPTTTSEILDYVASGSRVKILQVSADSGWYKIRVNSNGQEGWVAADFIEPISELGDIPTNQTEYTDAVYNGVAILSGINENARRIYRKGQSLGNRPDVFAKVGDSITYSFYFLDMVGDGLYNLDQFGYLKGVIDYFSVTVARDENSFKQDSVAAFTGWSAYALQDPANANAALCRPAETPLECEYRLIKPSVALIMLGTNDVGYVDPYAYRLNMEWIVTISMDYGVIPVISTIPNRPDVPERVNQFNQILRDVAAKYQVPLWDYNAALQDLPNYGLTTDNVHPAPGPTGYAGLADFSGGNLHYGYVIRNLTALQVLDSVWRQVIQRG